MNGAESLVRTLVGGGVDVCFANPGTSEMHFVAALDRVPGMHCVLGLFEGVVTGAADGYARMAGKPAATLLHLRSGLGERLAPICTMLAARHTGRQHRRRPRDLPPALGPTADCGHRGVGARRFRLGPNIQRCEYGWKRCRGGGAGLHDRTRAGGYADPSVRHLLERRGCGRRSVAAAATAINRPRTKSRQPRALRWGSRVVLLLGGVALHEEGLALAIVFRPPRAPRHRAGFKCAHARGQGRLSLERVPYVVDVAVRAMARDKHLILVGSQTR